MRHELLYELAVVGPAYKKFDVFYRKWQSAIGLVTGLVLIIVSVYVATIAVEVGSQRTKEAQTVKVACERSRTFGPAFLAFLEGTEMRLHLGALERQVMFGGKKQSVLNFYVATIPKSCP